MEKEIVSQLMSKLAVQMDGNQTDKEDVSHWHQILHQQLNPHNAQTVLLQTETEDVSQKTFQFHAQLVTWVTETETAFQYQHL